MLNNKFSPWPSFSSEEIDAVCRVLSSNRVNYWTGDEGRSFEKEFKEWTRSRYAIGLANGTVALDLALKGLEVGPGDEVIVTPRTFIASVSSVVMAGATPIFADVDPNSGNIEAKEIAGRISDRTRAIIPVHLGGWPCDMREILELGSLYGLKVIEDCAQAHGASIDGQSVGTFGDVGAWSFCQDKIMTTGGEGGMVTTDDEELWHRMWSYKDHGKNWDAVYERAHPSGFRWLHESFGTNWRMMEIQAVIGRIQLRQMASWTARRSSIAASLIRALKCFPRAVRVPVPSSDMNHAYYRLYAYTRPDGLKFGWTRDRILAEINARGVPAFQGTCSEVYLERAFDDAFRPEQRLPIAQELGESSLMFLTHPTLTDDELTRIANVITEVFSEAAC